MRTHILCVAAVLLSSALPNEVQAEPARLRIENPYEALSLAWSPDGKMLLVGTYKGIVSVIDPASGKELRSIDTGTAASSLAVSPDSTSFVVHHPRPMLTNEIWEIKSGKRVQCFYAHSQSTMVGFNDTGDNLWCVGPGNSRYTTLNGEILDYIEPHEIYDGPVRIAFDGTACGWCNSIGVLYVRARKNGQSSLSTILMGKADCFDLGRDGALAAVAGESFKGVELWNVTAEKKIASLTGLHKPPAQLSITGNGKSIAALSNDGASIAAWNLETGAMFRHITMLSRPCESLALSPDGKILATVERGGNAVLIWSMSFPTKPGLLNKVEPSADEFAKCWLNLISPNFDLASAAWRKLSEAHDQAVPRIREKFEPLLNPTDRKEIDKLLVELNSDKFVTRELAAKNLVAYGDRAIGALQRLVENPTSLEAATRARLILKKLAEPELSPERMRLLEAIDLLEQIGTPRAVELLREVAQDALISQVQLEAGQALLRITNAKNHTK